jgi:hypothetical protein
MSNRIIGIWIIVNITIIAGYIGYLFQIGLHIR